MTQTALKQSDMSEKKKAVYKPKPVSGFPEWLPEERLVEQKWFDHIRRIFERYGYCSIETPSVEELDVISAKGEVDKEIYVLERLHKDDEDDSEARLALHFDQTVPLARYVAQHFNDLVFPFKRYQMQRVWRGERPQAGRFREFYQCDIDVINVDNLPLHFDAEMPAIMWEILSGLPGMEKQNIRMRISNRKILLGIFEKYGLSNSSEILSLIDKKEKIPSAHFQKKLQTLINEGELYNEDIDRKLILSILTKLTEKEFSSAKEIKERIKEFGNKLIPKTREGIEELSFVMDQLSHLPKGAVMADLSIVRGLDYYTGTVYETVFLDDPSYGSICSGGRYDDLAGSYINKHLPGVGISIGFSRLFDRLRRQGAFETTRKSPADILMILYTEERRSEAAATARMLRDRNYNVELYHAPQKIKKQLSYAERKGIPYVWFPPFEDGQPHEIKNMAEGTQAEADPQNWEKDQK